MAELGCVVVAYRQGAAKPETPDWESPAYARIEEVKRQARTHFITHSGLFWYQIQEVEVDKWILSRKPLLEASPNPNTFRLRWAPTKEASPEASRPKAPAGRK